MPDPKHLAPAPPAVMLAYRGPVTLLAPALDEVVVADACPSALLGRASLTVMRTRHAV